MKGGPLADVCEKLLQPLVLAQGPALASLDHQRLQMFHLLFYPEVEGPLFTEWWKGMCDVHRFLFKVTISIDRSVNLQWSFSSWTWDFRPLFCFWCHHSQLCEWCSSSCSHVCFASASPCPPYILLIISWFKLFHCLTKAWGSLKNSTDHM